MILIGLGNRARQGKDTAAEAIQHYYTAQSDLLRLHGLGNGIKVSIVKFAAALYQEVNEALSVKIGGKDLWQRRYIEDYIPADSVTLSMPKIIRVNLPDWVQPDPNPVKSELSPYGKHPKLLQWWGTEFRRAQDPDYWVKKAMSSIPVGTNLALFTDVRFKNEAAAIKNASGYTVEVVRLEQDGTRYYATDRPKEHISEIELDEYNWDFNIMSKSAALTGEIAVTIAEFIRGLEEK